MRTVAIPTALRNVKALSRQLAHAAGRRHIKRPDDKAVLANAINAHAWHSLWQCMNKKVGQI
ncbi:hypothetical protein [Aeromonas eucrenophila]|uniref:Transposase n=1 Tax=Aeromonas eucrenophila TaxID=649 RepID=A0ABW0Y753_9GAMM|nr:hypothetical protein [Aeromonas eucrenophila]